MSKREGESQWGYSHRGEGKERGRDGLSGRTSKYLFLSFCMDLTVLIWQLRGMGVCVCERERKRDPLKSKLNAPSD